MFMGMYKCFGIYQTNDKGEQELKAVLHIGEGTDMFGYYKTGRISIRDITEREYTEFVRKHKKRTRDQIQA